MRFLIPLILALTSLCLVAQEPRQEQLQEEVNKDPQKQAVDMTPLRELGDEYQNSIKLLQNRFRIDYTVDEITMVFFRKYGSAPVVLVKPDGSKIFLTEADGENIYWYDTATYDLISIKNPTPGPWQAVGQILPESRVMVISDIKLHAEPLPDIIFSGEILKQTAHLTNGGKPIEYAQFRDVVRIEIRFVSTNNPDFNNFGADTETIATFEDNGRGMDETPLDGVFTGQFNLAVPNGEWTPVFEVRTPMFTREQIDSPIMLLPNPIKINILQDGGGEGYHKLQIDAEREHIDMTSLLIDGKVRFPNGDVQNFSLTEQTENVREHLLVNYEFGVYRIKLTVYGTTKDGREFILDVPEYTFLTEEPQPAPVVEKVPEDSGQQSTNGRESKKTTVKDAESDMEVNAQAEAETQQDTSMSTATMVSLIVGINLALVAIGGGIIWFMTREKKSKPAANAQPNKQDGSSESSSKIAILGKVKNIIKRKKTEPQEVKETVSSDDGGIINLKMPED